ncbi:MAG: hypothetical protein Kapaf2KO_14710 [Candidatus Kapaibacteriales bacterium]
MAKKQTFGDKTKRKAGEDKLTVKVLKWYKDENRGTLRFSEKFVKVDNENAIQNID